MKTCLIDSISNIKSMRFSRLAIKHLKVPRNWPVSIVHENIPGNGKVPFVVHKKTSEFVYILSGRAKAFLDNKSFNVTGGDYLLIPPGIKHRFITGRQPMTALSIFNPPMTFENLDAEVCNGNRKRKKEVVG